MLPICASCPTSASPVRISIAGIVSDREMSSSIRDWQETADLLPALLMHTELRNVLIPPSLEIDLVLIYEEGIRRRCEQPWHRCPDSGPYRRNVMPVNSICAPCPSGRSWGTGRRHGSRKNRKPIRSAALFHQRALGVQVVHVLRPVLNGGIPQFGVLAHKQLHAAGVEVGHIVFWGRAALDEMQVRTLCPQ